ncbi:DNA cytosine methyltransferase [Coleofasciculus sp. FACHB-64]|uniref:DNA cytosine methyltransferase n=1 Tax=Cyanophyceae TaxID=3028117 RepID=UPI001684185C|nr:DNA (cytosine-5-)-methyltransferase [Coleofasciculus sp. FACHB-501]MBD1839334.1 DNA cytosine methyltransferase [Coleofasciculus sp. FACHB-501]MBD2048535.1 DNA cytosine methyltransferase [Coleofasciculus sp. FACHB-64]
MQQLSLPLNLPGIEPDKVVWFKEILRSLGVSRCPAWPDQFGKSLHKWFTQRGVSPIRTLSLFSGGGGLDIAFHDAGFDIVEMVELEAKYVQTLEKNSRSGKWLENSKPICTDIKEFIPSPNLKVDFIIGGPPCQTFSAAGRRASGVAGTSDSRGTLFQEYVRLLKMLQPKGFLYENVYGITGAQKGEAWKEIQNAFKEAGYIIHFRVLDAADYGVPQHRERLFIVGIREGNYLFPYPTHGPDSPNQEPFYSAGEAVEGANKTDVDLGIGGRYGHLLTNIPPGLNYSFYTEEMGHPNPVFSWRSKFSDFLYKADPQMPVRTIKAQGGQYTGPFSWKNRRFTLEELKRLQTIPDDYEIVGNRQVCIEQIGNSVPPQLGRILALSILDQVMGINLPFPMHYLLQTKQLGFRQRKRQLTDIYAQKAKVALANLHIAGQITSTSPKNYIKDEQAVRFLSTDFSWDEEEAPNSIRINLQYHLDPSSWIITASNNQKNKDDNQYVIEIYPAWDNQDWILNTGKVKLCAKNLDKGIFTALWKAFEEKLIELTGMADLVQLSGYYQYAARITGVINFNSSLNIEPFWRVVQCIVRGIGVATQLPAQGLACQWGVNKDDVFSYLESLRSMGYEVRNYNTNPQIPKGEYLIPYAFPTLTPRSVQLRKNLK